MIMRNDLNIFYCGDETNYRKKKVGLTIMDQLILSIKSIRKNWSKDVKIFFIHTRSLASNNQLKLQKLKVKCIKANSGIEPEFPMSNKILVGKYFNKNANLLFLDCDTIIHKKINPNWNSEMLVAYDVLKSLSKSEYSEFFKNIQLNLPKGIISHSPAFDYYYNKKKKLFPNFNAGVFYINKKLIKKFYSEYENIFRKSYNKFKYKKWLFYIEQLSFCAAIVKLKINYQIFPKGYNFICTPRADYLKKWPKDKIYIEHYAGDTSKPINFS